MKKQLGFLASATAAVALLVSLNGCSVVAPEESPTTAKFTLQNSSEFVIGARAQGVLIYNRKVTPPDTIANWTATDTLKIGASKTLTDVKPGDYLIRVKSADGLHTWTNSSDITLTAGYETKWDLRPSSEGAGKYNETKVQF